MRGIPGFANRGSGAIRHRRFLTSLKVQFPTLCLRSTVAHGYFALTRALLRLRPPVAPKDGRHIGVAPLDRPPKPLRFPVVPGGDRHVVRTGLLAVGVEAAILGRPKDGRRHRDVALVGVAAAVPSLHL